MSQPQDEAGAAARARLDDHPTAVGLGDPLDDGEAEAQAALLGRGEALEELLESVRLDRKYADDVARKAILAVFDIIGPDTEFVREYQRRLSLILF